MLWIVRASQVISLLIYSEGFRITGLVCFKKPGATFTSDLVIFLPLWLLCGSHSPVTPWNFYIRCGCGDLENVVSGFGRRCRKASGGAPGWLDLGDYTFHLGIMS